MDPDLAELCQTIDAAELGRRIREARTAAGLTQGQLAGADVSIAYISRIEDGQRRPSPEVLESIAATLGIGVEKLLTGMSSDDLSELQYVVDQAEFALTAGDADTALREVEAVLEKIREAGRTELQRNALQVRATALEALGDVDGAIDTLRDLTATPSADARWLKALIALSRCYRESGDFTRAIAIGDAAAPVIAEFGIQGTTEAIQLSVTIAGAYIGRGDLGQARRLCKRAIETAEKYGSPLGQASAYWNASVVEEFSGNSEAALDLAKLAIAQFEIGDDSRNLGRLRAEIADLQLRVDPPDAIGALQTLEQADRELDWAPSAASDLARQHLTRGEANFLLGDHASALEYFRASADRAPESAPTLVASILVAQGQVAAAESRAEDARQLYQRAAQLLTGVGADRRAAQLWFDLGALLVELGDADEAREAFKRAGAASGLQISPRTRPRPPD